MLAKKLEYPVASLVGLAIALGSSPLLRLLMNLLLPPLEASARIKLQLTIKWFIILVLLVIVLKWERQPLSSIGIRRLTRRDTFWAFIGFLLGGLIIMFTMPLVSALGLGSTEGGVRKLGEFSFLLRVGMVLTAGITEEILYRGYAIERLYALTGQPKLSAGIAYLVFVALHIPFWGLGGTIQIGLGSIILYALYLCRRNLLACMLMHLLNDAVAFLLVPVFLPNKANLSSV